MAIVDSGRVRDKLVAFAEERAKAPAWVYGIPYGFPALDHITGGIQQGHMAVVISPANAGKSSWASKVARNVARYFRDQGNGKVVRYVTLEMLPSDLQMSMACMTANVTTRRIRSGFATPEQRARFSVAQDEMAALPIEYITEVDSIDQLGQQLREGGNCGFWVLDHIGLVPGLTSQNAPWAGLQETSKNIARLCRRIAPGLIIGHQTRTEQNEKEKRPTARGVAGSEQIVRDADKIFGLYRPDMFFKVPEDEVNDPKPSELLILKSRGSGGVNSTIHMLFDPERQDWVEDDEQNAHLMRED